MCCILLLHYPVTAQKSHTASYTVETIAMPEGLESQTGGIDFLPDGRLVACFMRGEVMIYDPQTRQWKMFAGVYFILWV